MFKIEDGRECFYQWDSAQRLIVSDASITEVHFCNKTGECSLVCEVFEEDGKRLVNVPNILLQENRHINVYAYDDCATKNSAVFKVIPRSKPEDYIYTETEVLTIKTAVNEAMQEAKDSGEFDGEDGLTPFIAENGNWWIGTTDTGVKAKGTDGADGKDGVNGANGKDGINGVDGKDGSDGYTPVRGTDYWTEADKAEIKSYVEEAILGGMW